MGIVQETKRKPDYYKDIEYGTVGENDFIEFIKKHKIFKNYRCFDVRKTIEYQYVDIDFVLVDSSYEDDNLPDINEVIENNDFIKIEVKTDSVAFSSGNLPYEVISHANSGWCVVTKCNLVYFVLTERNSDVIMARAFVDMEKWHKYCANRENEKRLSIVKNENIADLLCKMEDMHNKGVLRWVNYKTD